MDLFYVLLILLVATRVFGEIAEHVGQPALVGELIAGIAIGAVVAEYPGIFPDLVDLAGNEVFVSLTDLGMFLLMLFAGIEMQPHKIIQYSGGALMVALGGMALPLALGVGLGWGFLPESEAKLAQCLFIGIALAITAVPATVRILMDLGQLTTRVGQTIISAAVFDDIFSLILLAWLTGLLTFGEPLGFADVALLFGKIALFFVITTLVGVYVFPRGGRLMHYLKARELEISAVLAAAFAFAVLAEWLELHFIVGAFVAGLYFGRRTIDAESYERVKSAVSAMTFGFLAPIFFASIGFNLDLGALIGAPVFAGLLIACAFYGKIAGAGGAARAAGFSARDAAAIGVGMSPRGAVELVIAGIALEAGLFEVVGTDNRIVENLFSAVVVMAVVTTVLSPIILKRVFSSGNDSA
ncbi:MAG: cation:proton antiporter [Rhodospirillaceae bacterium]|nr:cation:proton antiporter [Rhodospirillaceae bacterium]